MTQPFDDLLFKFDGIYHTFILAEIESENLTQVIEVRALTIALQFDQFVEARQDCLPKLSRRGSAS